MTDIKRYYAFDSLRAAMMILGVVIHSSMSYSSSNDMMWPLRAKDTSIVFYYLVDFIHSFRMPVFFLMAGFFGAFLFYEKGPEQMLKNRFRRILLPFLVFILVLNPFVAYAFKYCDAIFEGRAPITIGQHFSLFRSYVPFRLFHLWFLYYLFIISILMYLMSKLAKQFSTLYIDKLFEGTFKNPVYRSLVLTCVSFFILFLFGAKSFETSISWFPNLGVLSYFLCFYITGWMLYRKRELINSLTHFDIPIAIFGMIAFCFKMNYNNEMSLIFLQIVNSIITCSLSMGIIGLFLRFTDIPNNNVKFFVNSAFWVYLIHFFFAILLTGLIDELTVSVYLKFLIVLSFTSVICLISYQFLVRRSFIGVFLNGKKY